MAIDPWITNNFLDSCAFDPKYAPKDKASIELLELYKTKNNLLLLIAHSTKKEIDHPNTPAWVKTEGQNLIDTIQFQLTSNEVPLLRKIESILAGNGKVETSLRMLDTCSRRKDMVPISSRWMRKFLIAPNRFESAAVH